MRRASGFTLIEVLVAMVVIAVALGATVRALGQAADVASALADRTVARWVAEDRAALLRASLPAAGRFPAVGSMQGRSEQDGRVWLWRTVASDPPESPFRRVEVHVRLADGGDGDQALLVLYLLRPLQ